MVSLGKCRAVFVRWGEVKTAAKCGCVFNDQTALDAELVLTGLSSE